MSLGSTIALVAGRVAEPVEDMQRAAARPWFAALGAVGRPVQRMQETVTGVAYASIRLGAELIGAAVDARIGPESKAAQAAEAVVGGLWGDDGTAMRIVDDGRPIEAGPDLSRSFPDATGHVVVLVHGLIQTEKCWGGGPSSPGLRNVLAAHPALTPIAVRYNTGMPVPESGRQLASLLERVVTHWPVPVETLAIVGHSMGGLVAMSACVAAVGADQRWPAAATDIVTIASPHRGAPLEKLAAVTAWGLRVAPQTRPLADFIDRRSQGIKDLRFGNVGSDRAAHPAIVRTLAGIDHHFVAGVVTSDSRHPVGAIIGDLMVRPASSTRSRSVEPVSVVVLGGKHHSNLLDDPSVIDHIAEWLDPDSRSRRGAS